MFTKVYLFIYILIKVVNCANGFTFYKELKLGEVAEISPDGVLKYTNSTSDGMATVFYSPLIRFKNSSNDDAISFSTMFAFEIIQGDGSSRRGQGIGFSIVPSKTIRGVISSEVFGLINSTEDGDPNNHAFSIEFDTSFNPEVGDIDGNHVGFNLNSIRSTNSSPAGYFMQNGEFRNLTLASSEPILAWVDYDGVVKQLNVTISPVNVNKPEIPLLNLNVDLSITFLEQMYLAFIAPVGNKQLQYVLGWSFQLNGKAPELDLSRLAIVSVEPKSIKKQKKFVLGISVAGLVFSLSVIIFAIFFLVRHRRKAKFTEILEDWEVQYGPHRFCYKDLFVATKGFRENNLVGKGGFGEVYRGVIPVSQMEVGVKRISHDSRQGMKEFVAEIATIGRLRHPNLVRLLGYCRRKGELFLVYDFMPNGSLDKFIFNKADDSLNWNQRFKIVKDVASGLSYLHEKWSEVIIHRDIKASNVLLDGDFNGKLGDFGLARSCHHGNDPQTTHLAGTLGYIAPELTRNGKATTSTDIFAFGAFCIEVVCGRRPVELKEPSEKVILVDWVLNCWRTGEILKTADPKLKNDFEVEEMELVLKVGLLCSHPVAAVRPSISQVLLYFEGHASVRENLDALLSTQESWRGLDDSMLNQSVSETKSSKALYTITESFTGR